MSRAWLSLHSATLLLSASAVMLLVTVCGVVLPFIDNNLMLPLPPKIVFTRDGGSTGGCYNAYVASIAPPEVGGPALEDAPPSRSDGMGRRSTRGRRDDSLRFPARNLWRPRQWKDPEPGGLRTRRPRGTQAERRPSNTATNARRPRMELGQAEAPASDAADKPVDRDNGQPPARIPRGPWRGRSGA